MNTISKEFFLPIYERMKEEFPVEELKPYSEFLKLFDSGKYQFFTYKNEKDEMVGFALGVCTSNGFFWLDYLQIFKEYQSGGYGSLFLKELLSSVCSKGILLETEAVDSDDINNNRVRRMRFYERFNIQQIDCPYLFPCSDGTYIDNLRLGLLPKQGIGFVSREDLKAAIRESVSIIHEALPHAKDVMAKYIDKINDLKISYFTLEEVNINNGEELTEIGKLIYYTDPYIYPAFYDNDINLSVKCAKKMLTHDTLFNHKNILVGKINGKVAGFMVILDHFPLNNYEQMKRAMFDSLGRLTPLFDEVMDGYFQTLNYDWEGLQIMSLAVLPEFRHQKVATKMLNWLPRKNTYSLACIKDNLIARELYRKCGFMLKYEYPGYVDVMCVELVRKGK